jgi:hypothetical protein
MGHKLLERFEGVKIGGDTADVSPSIARSTLTIDTRKKNLKVKWIAINDDFAFSIPLRRT